MLIKKFYFVCAYIWVEREYLHVCADDSHACSGMYGGHGVTLGCLA